MLLDVSVLRLLGKDDFRVLRSIELGMRNHELVPVPLIVSVARRRQSVTLHSIRELLKHKLIHHENVQYDGYRLTTAGYDFLAIQTLVCRGTIQGFGRRIGTGKESDVYEVTDAEGKVIVMKLHRLGRVSFRAVKNKRDYLRHRSNYNWLYLSRLAALGEYAFMSALAKRGFPVPEPIDQNRHVVLMSVVDGYPLSQVKRMGNPDKVFAEIVRWLIRLAEVGLVHCDFNEFNLMVDDEERLTIIDFPQMVSVRHVNAKELFERDRECIVKKRFHYEPDDEDDSIAMLEFEEVIQRVEGQKQRGDAIDKELHASGFRQSQRDLLERHARGEDIEDASASINSDDDSMTNSPRYPYRMPEAGHCCSFYSDASSRSCQEGHEEDRSPGARAVHERTVVKKVTVEQKKMMAKNVKRRLKKNTNKGSSRKSKQSWDM